MPIVEYRLVQGRHDDASIAELLTRSCTLFAEVLEQLSLRDAADIVVFGGGNTHLTNVDCKTIKGPDNTALSGDMAARMAAIKIREGFNLGYCKAKPGHGPEMHNHDTNETFISMTGSAGPPFM